jgi:hypothetical protein
LITEANAQVAPVKKKKTEVLLPDVSPKMGDFEVVEKREVVKPRELKGIILDSANNTPLAGASIIVKGTSRGVATDSLGNFKLSPDKDEPVELVVSYIGYQTQTLKIDSSTNLQEIKISLSPIYNGDLIVLGGYSVVYKKAKKKIINDWKPAILKKDIKIYPNPVMKGNNIQASLSLKQAGEYKMELLNVQGEVVAVQKLEMATKEQAVTIPTQSRWTPGIYLVRISAPGIKNVYQCKVSIQ